MLILFYRYPDAQLRDFNAATLVLDPLNGTTGFTYDANGNLLNVNRRAQQGSRVSGLLYSLLGLIVANGTTSSLGIYWRLVSCGVARRSLGEYLFR